MMKATWASIALTLAGTATTSMFAGDPVNPEGGSELASRVYDLGHLRMHSTDYGEDGVLLFPTSQARVRMGGTSWNTLSDSFVELAERVLWEELEYDGRSIDVSGDGHLYLSAPESTHKELTELLGFYEGLCTAETGMQLFWVQVPEGTEIPSGLVSAGEIVADHIDELPNNTYRVDNFAVPAYRDTVVRQIHSTPVMTDADVEIAQGVAAVDDVMRTVGSGRWAMVHAVPSIGGLQLSMTWSEVGRPILSDTPLDIVALFGAEAQASAPVRQDGSIQLMSQDANTSSIQVFVPDGMASVSKVSTKGGISTFLIAAPHTPAPFEQSYQLSGPRKDRGVAFLMRSLVPIQTHWDHDGSFGSPRHWSAEWCWSRQADSSEWMAERALDGIANDLVEYQQVGGYIVLHTAHGVSRDQLPVAHLELDRAVKRMRALVNHGASYKVTLTGFVGESEEVFQIEQVVSEKAKSSWFCGAERTFITDFDLEVAQYAAIHDPNVSSRMEGSMIELALVPDSKGHLQVQIDARISLPQSIVDVGSTSSLHAPVERMTHQQMRINTLRKLGGDVEHGWRARFGGYGGGGIYMDLKVELLD